MRDLECGLHHLLLQPILDELSGHPKSRARNADCGDHATGLVADGCGHTSYPFFILFVVKTVPLRLNGLQMFPESDGIRDRVLGSPGKTRLLDELSQVLLGEIGEEHLSYRATMGWGSIADSRSHSQAAGMVSGLHFFDVDNLPAIKNHHMNGLSDSVCKIPQKRFRLLSEIKLTEEQVPEFDQFEPQEIVPGLRILPDVTEIRQRRKKTVSGSFRKFELGGQVPDADAVGVLPEHLENGRDPLDGLDQIVRSGGFAHRFVLRNNVSQYNIEVIIFVKTFLSERVIPSMVGAGHDPENSQRG
jgi:hypothetical protein